jgi:hypothetical protein
VEHLGTTNKVRKGLCPRDTRETHLNTFKYGDNDVSIEDVSVTAIQRSIHQLHLVVRDIGLASDKLCRATHVLPAMVHEYLTFRADVVVSIHNEPCGILALKQLKLE